MKLTASGADQAAPAVIAANIAKLKLDVATDASAKVPTLVDGTSTVATGMADIVSKVAAAAGGSFYPVDKEAAANVKTWIDLAASIQAGKDVPKALGTVDQHLLKQTFMVGHFLTVADVFLACAICDPKVSKMTGKYVNLTRWCNLITAQPEVSAVMAPPKAAKAGGAAGAGPAGEEEDPAKKAKREAKQAEKAAKKAKAEAKAKANKEAEEKKKAAAASGATSKKALEAAEKAKKKEAKQAEYNAALQAVQAIPAGSKKDVNKIQSLSEYHPKVVEAGWYSWWEKAGFFTPKTGSSKPKYVIVIPPPNVTGTLHLGHALTNSIQDTIIRWRRMSGYECLWVPGTDHAGIATQTVVEKKIMKEEKKTRHDYGREPFLKEVWKWKEKSGGTICNQLRRLGSSLDWTREVFTMDDKLSNAVNEAFVVMHKSGLIYRDNRLVNWCCTLKTAISDIEVDYIEVEKRTSINVPGAESPVEVGAITSFAYPLEDGSGEIVVATTRPETMLGDTAVAVHPEDPRYTSMHGKFVKHPFNGRRMPIITDAVLVDMSFGTGAVKITPAHDPNDFATGKRHNLEFINIFTEDGKMNENGAPYSGMKRFTVRTKVVEDLKEKGLFRGVEDNAMRVPICSRSKDVIEPMIKPQWWVNCNQMAADACTAVRTGDLEVLPKTFEATWYRWLENIRDWCISRQLWWGHRIPAYYITLDGETGDYIGKMEQNDRWVVGRTEADARSIAEARFPGQAVKLEQDPDVLDTWFSSGLFPFSVMGWPEKTTDMNEFFPGALLETGHDILFFWVARMVMMSQTLTGKLPFKQVYLHAMVRDAHGRKMSKSLGNVIDPIHVIEGISLDGLYQTLLEGNLDPKEVQKAAAGQKQDFPQGIPECGTDALRFALAAYTTQARDINLDIQRVHGYRNWCNKLWNAIRFAMMNLGEGFMPSKALNVAALPMVGQWILSKLNATIKTVNESMEAFDFSAATTAVYAFWQYSLCDVFIELAKPILQADAAAAKRGAQEALWLCLDTGLRLLHPFMPFVTEELWQRLPRDAADLAATPSIMLAEYPTEQAGWSNAAVEDEMSVLDAVMRAVRQVRSKHTLTIKQKTDVYVTCTDPKLADIIARGTQGICFLCSSTDVKIVKDASEAPAGCDSMEATETLTVHLPIAK